MGALCGAGCGVVAQSRCPPLDPSSGATFVRREQTSYGFVPSLMSVASAGLAAGAHAADHAGLGYEAG